jgi:hypothetical protein
MRDFLCSLVRLGSLVLGFFLLSNVVSAQSAITGLVRDATGAVLPGVTVEASSPVLIEKVRSVVSDADGRYTIVDLRPGVYSVTFALTGFNTLKREDVELPGNFTMTLNADLRVGGLAETLTVTGASPIIDVQNTQRTQVVTRELLDALPSARNLTGLAALMPGVRMTNTDVGGNQQMEQVYMVTHGSRLSDSTVQMDGMAMNSLLTDNQVQAYFSDASHAEVTYQTSGLGADVSGGGVKINMIPKEGGNRLSGSAFIGGTDGSWQSNNVTPDLTARGLKGGNRIDHIYDVNFGLGGPIVKDKLWFFASYRKFSTNDIVANAFYKDGSPAVEEQGIQNQMVRLTWQMTPKNKLTAYHDRYPKYKLHELGAFYDPATAAYRRDQHHALYATGQVKYTSTLTSKLLLESGFATNIEYLTILTQPGIAQPRFSPAWYTNIGKYDLTTTQAYDGVPAPTYGIFPAKYVTSAGLSYVTGSHAIKTGMQWGFGYFRNDRDVNGDLIQYYLNGVPSSVAVQNTPVTDHEVLHADMGIYAQDSWTRKQLTLNMGVRFEYFNGALAAQEAGAGRFVPVRQLAEVPNLPNWKDIAPRFGASYDLFGNAKTALKGTVNRYMAGQGLGFAQRYNPMYFQSDVRTWRDVDLIPGTSIPSGQVLPTNGDNIAEDNEIGPPNNKSFGQPILQRRPDPNIGREYDWEYTAAVQHELLQGLQVSATWIRRDTYNMTRTTPTQFAASDYNIINIVNPLDGTSIPIYNLNPLKNGLLDRVDTNSTDSNLRSLNYHGFELGATGRFHGATFFGGWTMDKRILVHCDEIENWGNLAGPQSSSPLYPAGATNTNQPKSDYQYCDQAKLNIPFFHEFKLSGSYLLPWWGIQTNAAFQSYPGAQLPTRWNLTRTTVYPANCKAPCTPGALVIPNLTLANYAVDLTPPGTDYYLRQNQLDWGLRKLFKVKQYTFSAQMDLFNALNSSYVQTQLVNLGPTLGTPTKILQPRLLRLAMQMRF